MLSGDRLHPTDAGRRVLAESVAAALGPVDGIGECLRSTFRDDSSVGGNSTTRARAAVDAVRVVERHDDHDRPAVDVGDDHDGRRRAADGSPSTTTADPSYDHGSRRLDGAAPTTAARRPPPTPPPTPPTTPATTPPPDAAAPPEPAEPAP